MCSHKQKRGLKGETDQIRHNANKYVHTNKKYKDMSRLYKYDLQIPLPSKVDRGRKECKKGKR